MARQPGANIFKASSAMQSAASTPSMIHCLHQWFGKALMKQWKPSLKTWTTEPCWVALEKAQAMKAAKRKALEKAKEQ